jgi:hypothetical protein
MMVKLVVVRSFTSMQLLNVRAGQTEQEYEAAEQQQHENLRSESQSDAAYFFWAAGLASLASGLFPIYINIAVSIGVIDLLRFYGKPVGALYPIVVYGSSVAWVLVMVGLGFAARKGYRWAFMVGIAFYAIDLFLLIVTFSMLSVGVHAFFIYRWFQGQRALKDLRDAETMPHASKSATAAGQV